MMEDQGHLQTLREAADQCRLVRIEYRKPGAVGATVRVVEPYRLARAGSAAMVVGWQVEPEALGDTSWRNFRLDRITGAEATEGTFEPRIEVRLDAEPEAYVYGYTPTDEQTPAQAYFAALEGALLGDGIGDEAAMAEARRLAGKLDADRVRTVHARLYRDVLDALLVDGRIDAEDEKYLRRVAGALGELGWSPAGG